MNDHKKNTPEIEDSGNEIIGTMADVARWLRANGYCAPGKDQPSKNSRKIYEDKKKGLFRAADLKNITKMEVESYIVNANLIKIKTGGRIAEIEDLSVLEKKENLELVKIKRKRAQLDYDVQIGKLKDKKEVDLHVAMAIGVLEAGIKHLMRTSATELTSAVGGDVKKSQLICDMLYPGVDALLDQFGRMDEIKIVVRKQKGMIDGNAASHEEM